MGNDFHYTCQVETWKVLWLIGLVFASVFVLQYFELPYNAYFKISDANGGAASEKRSDLNNSSSPSIPKLGKGSISDENVLLENTMKMNHTAEEESIVRSIIIAPAKATDSSDRFSDENAVADISPSLAETENTADISPSISVTDNSTTLISVENARIAKTPPSIDVALAPIFSPSESVSPRKTDIDLQAPVAASSPSISETENRTSCNGSCEILKSSVDQHSSSTNSTPKEKPMTLVADVVSISEMNDILLHSRASFFPKSPLWPSAADQELLDARLQIQHAAIVTNHPGLYAPIYRNLTTFVRSYEIMEQKLKIYIYNYKDLKRPVFHQPRLKGIYASEGWFMKLVKANKQFVTSNPEEAHLFYLPFSSQLLVDYVYVPNSHTFHDIIAYLRNYLDMIKVRHGFWNRTEGADHFLVACHDWAPIETRRLMSNSIRVLCNSDIKEGFHFGKDVSLPETSVHSPQNPLQEIGGQPPSKRKILAFFAGQMHGNVRPILLKYWENKDADMKIVGRMRKGYIWHMKNSKYCICAKGYEVNSPRVVEAIMYGWVPVIISDNFVPPFFDVLNWESFAVFVLEKDIPNLKNILISISDRRYVVMQHRVKLVRQHFLWHNAPVKYDIFHMILHSIWYNRVYGVLPK